MQNISHVPLRIDWIVYDIVDDAVEKPQLIELIPVIDHNPFDTFDSKPRANIARALSHTTTTSSKENGIERVSSCHVPCASTRTD